MTWLHIFVYFSYLLPARGHFIPFLYYFCLDEWVWQIARMTVWRFQENPGHCFGSPLRLERMILSLFSNDILKNFKTSNFLHGSTHPLSIQFQEFEEPFEIFCNATNNYTARWEELWPFYRLKVEVWSGQLLCLWSPVDKYGLEEWRPKSLWYHREHFSPSC